MNLTDSNPILLAGSPNLQPQHSPESSNIILEVAFVVCPSGGIRNYTL